MLPEPSSTEFKMSNHVFIVALLLAPLATLVVSDTFHCEEKFKTLNGSSGFLDIKRNQAACGFEADADSMYFAIRTDDLKLYNGESLTINPGESAKNPISITENLDPGLALFQMPKVRIEFKLSKLDGSMMRLQFFQSKNSVATLPIDSDKSIQLTIRAYDTGNFNLAFSKSVKDPAHLELTNSGDTFGHYLMEDSNKTIPVKITNNQPIVVKTTLVRADCSKNYVDETETSHEIVGPDAKVIDGNYKCVNIFTTSMKDQAHFDVNFSNFLDIVDNDDELIIDDGLQPLKIIRYTAKHYYQLKPNLSFKNQRLAVIYDSPVKAQPRAVFRLTVSSKAFGGVIDEYRALSLPTKGSARYTLRSQDSDSISALEIKGKLTGAKMSVRNYENDIIALDGNMFLPPVIAFNEMSDTYLDFDIVSKVPATLSYRRESNCSGTIFGTSGTISLKGNNTCYWLIGSSSVLNIDSHNLQQTNSCLEIHPLDSDKPMLNLCNIDQAKVFPQFSIGPAYLKITLASEISSFDASISQTVNSLIQTSKGQRTIYSSSGYPASYVISNKDDKFSIDAKNKSMVLSVADIDIRTGEKMMVNNVELSGTTYLASGDIDISNKLTDVVLKKSPTSNDFDLHKGYSLIVNQYDIIISADMKKTSIQTPKNSTSLLLRISAPQSKRLTYNITSLEPKNLNYVMNVTDSKSLLGRRVDDKERLNGTSTSSTILISFETTAPKAVLPEFKIAYSQLACNQTSDHVCDQSTRCVPAEKLCKGKSYCLDGSDSRVPCTSGPIPQPQIITTGGYSGISLFIMSVVMFSLGILATIYGPDLYKSAENRFRSGQYTTFTSTE